MCFWYKCCFINGTSIPFAQRQIVNCSWKSLVQSQWGNSGSKSAWCQSLTTGVWNPRTNIMEGENWLLKVTACPPVSTCDTCAWDTHPCILVGGEGMGCMCTWKPEVDGWGSLPQFLSTLILQAGLSLNPELPYWLDWLREASCLHPPPTHQ